MPKIASHVANFNNLWHHDSAIKDMRHEQLQNSRDALADAERLSVLMRE